MGETFPRWGIPIIVVVMTVAAFYPALQNQFVNWDDYKNFVENPYYRGLGSMNIRWMFTTFHMGPYQPLSWLTLALDYLIWGMNPFGYHLTSLMLHAATAVAFLFPHPGAAIYRQRKREEQNGCLDRGSGFALVLLPCNHPLRVESVAWTTERRDVLSGLFYTLTILLYLHAGNATNWVDGTGGMGLSSSGVYAFFCFKIHHVTLPVVLLLLDIYPLERLGGSNGWWSQDRQVLFMGKAPICVAFGCCDVVAFIALAQSRTWARCKGSMFWIG